MRVTKRMLSELGIPDERAATYLPALRKALPQHDIDTPLRVAHFLAQVIHESGGFRRVRENLRYSAERLLEVFPGRFTPEEAEEFEGDAKAIANRVYANRLGNGDEASGDGFRYRGRGLIQITGKGHYRRFSRFIDDDVVAHPDRVARKYAVESAVYFWKLRNINEAADADDVKRVTRKVHGGKGGLEQRARKLERAKQALRMEPTSAAEKPTPILRYRSTGRHVERVQRILAREGHYDGAIDGKYGRRMEDAVAYFQQTHLGKDGCPLGVDGIVGPATWWALRNPHGKPQRSHIDPRIPEGLAPSRVDILETALQEHAAGVCEKPNGANRGDGVDKYLPKWRVDSKRGAPWCAFFWCWAMREALGTYPFRRRLGSVYSCYRAADKQGLWKPAEADPIPGDAFVMLSKGTARRGSGHIGFVLRVEGDRFNTVEGNAGNRVKVGLRERREVVGWIRAVADGDDAADFERGVVAAEALRGGSTR